MVLVQLSSKQVEYFKNLEAINPWTQRSEHPDEVAGELTVDKNGNVQITNLSTGVRTETHPLPGAVTFHTHNVPPGDVYHNNLSTDVPSWQDFRTVCVGTMQHGLKDHLIFTPNYSYVVSVGPVLLRNLQEQARLGTNSFMTFATLKTHGRYVALVNSIGANYGANFISQWIDEMRKVGFVIEQRRKGETVYFESAGPLPESQNVSSPLETDNAVAVYGNLAAIGAVGVLVLLLMLWSLH